MNPIFTRRTRSTVSSPSHARGSSSLNSGRKSPSELSEFDRTSPCSSPTDPEERPRRSSSPRQQNQTSCQLENLLAIKQNMLAQVSLTPEENMQRKSSTTTTSKSVKMAVSSDSSPEEMKEKAPEGTTMVLCDIEDEEYDFGRGAEGGSTKQATLDIRKPILDGRPIMKTMDAQVWRDLKNIVVGPNAGFMEGWLGQGFPFDHNLLYGLVQKRGGPCGVLAAVQAIVLRNLIFGSPICDDDELPLPESTMLFSEDPSSKRTLTFRRTRALVCALTEILWRCGTTEKSTNKEEKDDNNWDFNVLKTPDEGSAVVCFSGASIGADLRVFQRMNHLKNFIHGNLTKFDCISLVYSAVLSRGIEQVQEDFDFPNCPLLGSHGYCSQELVNLLITGKAISNVFDNQISLDDKILKGIESRSDVGLLSLFEHYDSCQVGDFLKSPKFPVWIVCSESHFSVLFSTNPSVAGDCETSLDKFELFYFDGLARQQSHIRLSIELADPPMAQQGGQLRIQSGSSASSFNHINNNNNNGSDGDEDLVPPLEKCIRTKWRKARVDWNETEPIL